MLRKLAIATLLCTAMGTANAAPAGTGIGRIPIVGPLVQGLLPGGTAFIPIVGIPIPLLSTEPLLGLINPLLNGLRGPLLTFGGPVIDNLLTPLVVLANPGLRTNPRLAVAAANARSQPGTTLPGLLPATR